MEAHPEVHVVGGAIREFNDEGTISRVKEMPMTQEAIKDYVKLRNPLNPMTVMYRKDAILEAGNYALLEKMARKIPIFPKVKNERSMIYIENLCECLRRMIETGYEGIFCPQNEAYVITSEMVAQIRRSYGKRPVLMPGFGWLIRILAGKINLFAKVFGTLTYDKEMSQDAKLGAYNIIDFGEGINASKH